MEEVRASVRALPDSGGGRQQWRQLPTQQGRSMGQDAHHSPMISPVQLMPGRPAEKSKERKRMRARETKEQQRSRQQKRLRPEDRNKLSSAVSRTILLTLLNYRMGFKEAEVNDNYCERQKHCFTRQRQKESL